MPHWPLMCGHFGINNGKSFANVTLWNWGTNALTLGKLETIMTASAKPWDCFCLPGIDSQRGNYHRSWRSSLQSHRPWFSIMWLIKAFPLCHYFQASRDNGLIQSVSLLLLSFTVSSFRSPQLPPTHMVNILGYFLLTPAGSLLWFHLLIRFLPFEFVFL